MQLRELEIGQSAVITEVGGEGALRQHFLDMGMVPGAEVKLIKYAQSVWIAQISQKILVFP